MTINYAYTQKINDFIKQNYEDQEAIKFLLDPMNFRDFSVGLTEAITKSGYTEDPNNIKLKTKYLSSKLKSIGSSICPKTIYSWFNGDHRPKIEPCSRKRMFEICFALEFSYDDVKWFFSHVYFERCFNYNILTEAIYFYCFKHNYPYSKALELITIIKESPEAVQIHPELEGNYTHILQEKLMCINSEEELISFLNTQKSNFHSWNQSALNMINSFVNNIRGSKEKNFESIKKLIAEKDSTEIISSSLDDYGLIVQEIIYESLQNGQTPNETIRELSKKKPSKYFRNDFLINFITSSKITSSGILALPNIPSVIKNNFPSEKTFSNILDRNKAVTSKSYDSIRKILILLHFYQFWCSIKIKNLKNSENLQTVNNENEYIEYIEETTFLLNEVGYEPLYAGNPYDWIFLHSASTDDPLDFFRDIMAHLSKSNI